MSPVRPSKFFDGELTDGQAIIRLVGFERSKRQLLQSFIDSKAPVTLRNCQIQHNKYKGTLEVVVKNHTAIEASEATFDVSDIKTCGSALVSLDRISELSEHDRVTVRVTVLKVYEPEKLLNGKIKQDVKVGDTKASATVTLWGDHIGLLKLNKSYQLNRLEVRSYANKIYLSFPSTPSIDSIKDIKGAVKHVPSPEHAENESLEDVTVMGIKQLDDFYTCMNCSKHFLSPNSQIGTCDTCGTTQKLSAPYTTAKLIVECGGKKFTLRAYEEILKSITQTQSSITSQDLLFALPFDCQYNKFNVITQITRK